MHGSSSSSMILSSLLHQALHGELVFVFHKCRLRKGSPQSEPYTVAWLCCLLAVRCNCCHGFFCDNTLCGVCAYLMALPPPVLFFWCPGSLTKHQLSNPQQRQQEQPRFCHICAAQAAHKLLAGYMLVMLAAAL